MPAFSFAFFAAGLACGVSCFTNAGEIASVVRNAPDTPHGAPCVWPMIERYAPDVPRHSGTIWPQVNAAWCLALAQNGFREEAYRELKILTDHVYRDCGFFEIYHPETGLPYGGVQENDGGGGVIRWYPRRGQLWCATGLIGMVLHVFFGLDPRPEGLVFHPWLPEGLPEIRLNGLPWRNTMLNLRIRRSRKKGGKAFFLPGSVRGRKLVDLTV